MALRQPKIGLIGSGQIGGIIALVSGLKHLGEVYLYDVIEHTAQGKALDLNHASTIDTCTMYKGSANSCIISDSDVIIITAGIPRKPGMSRDDLLLVNGNIIKGIAKDVAKYSPEAFVICVTNPLDAMVQLFQRESGLSPSKVVGMAGVLDSARFSFFLSEALNISPESIQACVLGNHGDSMVILPRYTSINGIPLTELIDNGWITIATLDKIIQRTRYGGQEIVELLKSGSAFFAPAFAAIKMAEAYLKDQKAMLTCCAYLNNEYGVSKTYAGVPVIIGAKGVEKIIELNLTSKELEAMQKSVNQVQKLIDYFDSQIGNC